MSAADDQRSLHASCRGTTGMRHSHGAAGDRARVVEARTCSRRPVRAIREAAAADAAESSGRVRIYWIAKESTGSFAGKKPSRKAGQSVVDARGISH